MPSPGGTPVFSIPSKSKAQFSRKRPLTVRCPRIPAVSNYGEMCAWAYSIAVMPSGREALELSAAPQAPAPQATCSLRDLGQGPQCLGNASTVSPAAWGWG